MVEVGLDSSMPPTDLQIVAAKNKWPNLTWWAGYIGGNTPIVWGPKDFARVDAHGLIPVQIYVPFKLSDIPQNTAMVLDTEQYMSQWPEIQTAIKQWQATTKVLYNGARVSSAYRQWQPLWGHFEISPSVWAAIQYGPTEIAGLPVDYNLSVPGFWNPITTQKGDDDMAVGVHMVVNANRYILVTGSGYVNLRNPQTASNYSAAGCPTINVDADEFDRISAKAI